MHIYEAGASGGEDIIALSLLHVDVGDDIGVKEGGHGIHLLDFKIIMTCESKENTECGITNGGGKTVAR